MTLEPGTQLGPYEVVSRLGVGGMGEVYRARDPRLGRDVAIKTSAAQFSERFEREARAVAALNHTNICSLYDIGPNYLVMELIEGPTLGERLDEGPLTVDEAIGIARQIGEALEAAHEKGIVHRDLKPANIKLASDGRVKVLDFGLAKVEEKSAAQANLENSPTMTLQHATEAGMIMGTAAYMAPEQARGKAVDKRADIWAFGVVFYEMLTRQRAFAGETVSDILANVLTRELDLEKAPQRLRRLLAACLERDPKKRLRDIGDVWKLVDDDSPAAQAAVMATARKPSLMWPIAAAVAILAAAALAFVHFRETEPAPDVVRFRVSLPDRMSFINDGMFIMSPDGNQVAFRALGTDGQRSIWVQSLDSFEPRRLNVDSEQGLSMIWAPDSRAILVQDRGGDLERITLVNGDVQPLAAFSDPVAGGSWAADGTILLGTPQGVVRITESGGTPVPVTQVKDGETFHAYPVLLPDGKRFLYLAAGSEMPALRIGSLDKEPGAQSTKVVLAYGSAPLFARRGDGGELLFIRNNALVAQPLDIDGEQLTGTPRVLAEQVDLSNNAYPFASVSANGRLAYRGGAASRLQLTWFNRQGQPVGTVGDPDFYGVVVMSPDDRRVAVSLRGEAAQNIDIWHVNLSDGGTSRFTFDPAVETQPVWSADATRMAFRGDGGLFIKASNGSGGAEKVMDSSPPANLTDWSRDGRYLLFHRATEWDPLESTCRHASLSIL